MNTPIFTDLLPYFCCTGRTYIDKLQAIQVTSTLQQTDKSLYATISKDSFWSDLLLLLGEEAASNSGNYKLVKYKFKIIHDWMTNTPKLTHTIENAMSLINHPLHSGPKLKVISLSSKIYAHTLLQKRKNRRPRDFTPIFTANNRKFYTCVAQSNDYLAINKDDSNVQIFKNKKSLLTTPFNGIIQQIEIREDYLYIRGINQNGHVLNILNLNLESTPQEISIPHQLISNAWFGQSHIVIAFVEGNTTFLVAASYKDLRLMQNNPWMELAIDGSLTLFENKDRFTCIIFGKHQKLGIGELSISNGCLNYQVIEKGITILQSSSGVYLKIDCIQGRIFTAYNEYETNRICTYDIETKQMSHFKLSDGPGFHAFLPLPSFVATTSLRIYYLTFPFENGNYNPQKISIYELDYES